MATTSGALPGHLLDGTGALYLCFTWQDIDQDRIIPLLLQQFRP